MVGVINNPGGITAEWLTRTLRLDGCLSRGHVAGVDVASEASYTSTITRLTLTYSDDAPPTVPTRLLLKLSRLDVVNTRKHFARFADTLGNRLSASGRQIYERTLASLPGLWERVTRRKGLTLIHGDANLSNVLLPHDPDQESAMIIDWQLWGISFAAEDLAHLIALFWDKEDRQGMEKELLMRYHQGLIRYGVENYQWADCWHDYRLAVILRVLFKNLVSSPVHVYIITSPSTGGKPAHMAATL